MRPRYLMDCIKGDFKRGGEEFFTVYYKLNIIFMGIWTRIWNRIMHCLVLNFKYNFNFIIVETINV